jgi:hypothetical protein
MGYIITFEHWKWKTFCVQKSWYSPFKAIVCLTQHFTFIYKKNANKCNISSILWDINSVCFTHCVHSYKCGGFHGFHQRRPQDLDVVDVYIQDRNGLEPDRHPDPGLATIQRNKLIILTQCFCDLLEISQLNGIKVFMSNAIMDTGPAISFYCGYCDNPLIPLPSWTFCNMPNKVQGK